MIDASGIWSSKAAYGNYLKTTHLPKKLLQMISVFRVCVSNPSGCKHRGQMKTTPSRYSSEYYGVDTSSRFYLPQYVFSLLPNHSCPSPYLSSSSFVPSDGVTTRRTTHNLIHRKVRSISLSCAVMLRSLLKSALALFPRSCRNPRRSGYEALTDCPSAMTKSGKPSSHLVHSQDGGLHANDNLDSADMLSAGGDLQSIPKSSPPNQI